MGGFFDFPIKAISDVVGDNIQNIFYNQVFNLCAVFFFNVAYRLLYGSVLVIVQRRLYLFVKMHVGPF